MPDQLTDDANGRLHRLQALLCLPNANEADHIAVFMAVFKVHSPTLAKLQLIREYIKSVSQSEILVEFNSTFYAFSYSSWGTPRKESSHSLIIDWFMIHLFNSYGNCSKV